MITTQFDISIWRSRRALSIGAVRWSRSPLFTTQSTAPGPASTVTISCFFLDPCYTAFNPSRPTRLPKLFPTSQYTNYAFTKLFFCNSNRKPRKGRPLWLRSREQTSLCDALAKYLPVGFGYRMRARWKALRKPGMIKLSDFKNFDFLTPPEPPQDFETFISR